MPINLGAKVKDKITQTEGIATGKASYITGCDQYLVQPPILEGKYRDPLWIDEGRLEVLEDEAIKLSSVKAEKNGAGYPAPVK